MSSRLNEKGEEIVDSTPMQIPVGFKAPESLASQVARLVRGYRAQAELAQHGVETFEEANDFDVGDPGEQMPDCPFEEEFVGQFDREIELERVRQAKEKAPPRQPRRRKVDEDAEEAPRSGRRATQSDSEGRERREEGSRKESATRGRSRRSHESEDEED